MVVCGQTLRQVVAQLELELLRPCQFENCLSLQKQKPKNDSHLKFSYFFCLFDNNLIGISWEQTIT